MPKLDPVLTDWLNHTVYPKLNHDLVFGNLTNYHGGPPNGDFYADCPRCHRKGTFYGYGTWHVGQCKSCTIPSAGLPISADQIGAPKMVRPFASSPNWRESTLAPTEKSWIAARYGDDGFRLMDPAQIRPQKDYTG